MTSTNPGSKTKIHREMTISDIFTFYPQKAQKLAQEMTKAGLQCAGCGAATWETLEAGMSGHGMNDQMIDKLIVKLNQIIEEEVDLNTISLTPRAAKKYLEILADEGKQGWGIRLAEQMAGCNGFEYVLDYCEKNDPDDVIFTSQGIEIYVNKNIEGRLKGAEIDYIDGLNSSGFKVTNPNVRSSCGCGTSHGY